jgi:hypothetical protein
MFRVGWSESLQSESLQSESLQSESLQSESLQSESLQSESLQSESLQSASLQSSGFSGCVESRPPVRVRHPQTLSVSDTRRAPPSGPSQTPTDSIRVRHAWSPTLRSKWPHARPRQRHTSQSGQTQARHKGDSQGGQTGSKTGTTGPCKATQARQSAWSDGGETEWMGPFHKGKGVHGDRMDGPFP